MNAALASPTTADPIKSYDLVWLIHLVGDVHQPLHAAERYRQNDPNGDSGGNGVKLRCAAAVACASNLHSLWDGMLGTSLDFAQITAQGNSLNGKPVPPGADNLDPNVWVQESFDLGRSDAYTNTSGAGDPLADIDAATSRAQRRMPAARADSAGLRVSSTRRWTLRQDEFHDHKSMSHLTLVVVYPLSDSPGGKVSRDELIQARRFRHTSGRGQ